LVSYGIIRQFVPALQRLDRSIDDQVLQNSHRSYIFDDYVQYAPYAGVYLSELCGIKAKHNTLDRTIVLASSIIICTSAVQISKRFTGVTRPDSSNKHAFPSGHTATAFLGAHLLFREHEEVSPWIGVAGYGVATTTGVMRVINRKHWFSDIVAGAGVGIISVELSYLLLPVWQQFFKMNGKDNYMAINPLINQNSWGISVVSAF
jgi:hypothetical protein